MCAMNSYPPRKTRIIATLGPSCEKFDQLKELVEAGTNVFRINFSHAKHEWGKEMVRSVRELEKTYQRPLGILIDTQGPSIRTGVLTNPIDLKPKDIFTFTVRGEKIEEGTGVDVNYDQLVDDLSIGDLVLVDNGMIRFKVIEKPKNGVRCEVLTQGILRSRRHMNLPGIKVNLPSITEKDYEDVRWGAEQGVDYVALSFVRSSDDIKQLKEFLLTLKSSMRVIAKIEDKQAVQNLETIIAAADGIMVARGDLGIEIPFEELPIIQRKIVKACLRLGKPVIIATHMLESMHENPMPTRAEVTDVANAIFEQVDAVMLSGETGIGRYPVKCVETLDIISRKIEQTEGKVLFEHAEFSNDRQQMVASAITLANEIKATGILVFTHAGNSAQMVSWLRPRTSHIYAFTPTESVWRQMSLYWGVRAFKVKLHDEDLEVSVTEAIQILEEAKWIRSGDKLVLISQIQVHGKRHDSIQFRQVL